MVRSLNNTQLFQFAFEILTTARQITLEPVGSDVYFTEKNRFVQAKAVRIYPSTVSIRSEPAVTIYIAFLFTIDCAISLECISP